MYSNNNTDINKYLMPTEVLLGKGCIKKSTDRFREFGKKALIVTGRSSAVKSGAQQDVLDVLTEQSIEHVIFNEIVENPTVDSVVKGAEVFRTNNCDHVIAIGGGSPLDAGKAIALAAKHNIKTKEEFFSTAFSQAHPVVAIPTTSGTGSEATQYSIITDTESNTKKGIAHPAIFPVCSFLDPTYTISLNENVTRNTAIDALSHLLEGIYSKRRNPLTYPMIFQGVKLIYDNLKKCLQTPENYELREKLMIASLYGGVAIAQTGTTVQHSIGYPLTTEYGIAHGLANGVVMKDIMETYYPYIKYELNQLFHFIGINKIVFFSWLRELLADVKVDITDTFIEKQSVEVAHSSHVNNTPGNISPSLIKKIYLQLK